MKLWEYRKDKIIQHLWMQQSVSAVIFVTIGNIFIKILIKNIKNVTHVDKTEMLVLKGLAKIRCMKSPV